MAEMHDEALRRSTSDGQDWAELKKTARKVIESCLEFADGMESA